jgi:hypothetical protein
LGHGQIITRKNEISKSIDIVIFDNIENAPLIYNAQTQIFPIESVYGIIECKSHLTKEKLIEGLENIKSVKSIAPKDRAVRKDVMSTITYPRPKPFGIIFAYSLGNNSIDSIMQNLEEWEKNNDLKYWPNLVVILNEALIFHRKVPDLEIVVTNEEITRDVILGSNRHKNEVFFKFYIYLMDLCSSMQLGGFRLKEYFDLPDKIGDLLVKGNDKWVNRKTGEKARLKYDFLKRIYDFCNEEQKSNYVDVFKKAVGSFIYGTEEKKYKNITAYLFNPDNYPGIHEVKNAIGIVDGETRYNAKVTFPFFELIINEKLIYVPQCYLEDDVLEELE